MYNTIGANFKYTIDIEGKSYYSLSLDWNYKLGYADTSILKYVPATLKKLLYSVRLLL